MSSGLNEILSDLLDEENELDSIVSALETPEWDLPTPAEGWAIRDQVSHLAFFDETAALALRSPEQFIQIADSAVAALSSGADPMQEHLVKGRSMLPADLLAWWRAPRTDLLLAAAESEPSARVPWFGPPMGAKSFVSARIMEVWAHGQDIADCLALERTPTVRLRHVAHLGVISRPFSYALRSLELPPEPVYVALDAPDGTTWDWGATDAEFSVAGPAVDFCLVVTRRRKPSETALLIRGDRARDWMAIAQAFAGPPGPERG